MKNVRAARPVILFAAVCAALVLAGSGHASTDFSVSQNAVNHNDARHFAHLDANLAPTLEELLEPFSFDGADAATSVVSQHAMSEQLSGRGLSETGRSFADGQQTDLWYSAAEDRSVVCVSGAGGGQSTQAVWVMPGKVRRGEVPLP